MTDPKDHSAKTLEEVHRRPLTDEEQTICDQIRREISSMIAWWVETQFRIGNTREQVWEKLSHLRNLVYEPTPLDSAGVDLANVPIPEFDEYDPEEEEDYPPHKVDGRNPDR